MYKPNINVCISSFHWFCGYMVCYYGINLSKKDGFWPIEFYVGKLQPSYLNAGYYGLHRNKLGDGIFICNDERTYIGIKMKVGVYKNDFFTKR